jgi:hypothetical protein
LKAALGLTFLVAGIYLFTASGHLDGQDQEYYYRMARAVAQQHKFAIEPLVFQDTEIAGRRGRNGHFYAEYAAGLPLMMAPWVASADLCSTPAAEFQTGYHWMRDRPNDVLERILVSYFDLGVVAATAGVLLLLVRRLGYPHGAAIFVGGTFALSTFVWGQGRIINPEPLQTLLLVIAILLTLAATTKRAFLGGCALGFAVLVKSTSVLALPALLMLPNYGSAPRLVKLRTVFAIVLPVLGGLFFYSLYNYARFGSLFATGYNISGRAAELGGNGIGNPITGFYGLLFSTGRGLIWYAPPVLAGVAGYSCFYRQNKSAARALALLAVIWIALHSCYQGWDSGWGWGPRYLLPILPFMLVPIAETLKLRAGKILCVATAVIGLLIQIPGALVDFMASGRAGMSLFAETVPEQSAASFVSWRNFQIAGSEIVRHFALLRHGQVDVAWLTFRHTWIFSFTFCLTAVLVLSGLILIFTDLRAQRRLARSPMTE